MSSVTFKVGINYAFLHHNYNPDYKGKQGYCLQGSGGCFHKFQKVITNDGSKYISDIRIGDLVLSYNETTNKKEYREVEQTFIHNNQKRCYEIKLPNQQIIKCTYDHEFYLKKRWITAEKLILGGFKPFRNSKRIHLEKSYDIAVENNSNYYLDCGSPILVHNSGKTYDALFFILTYCRNNANRGKRIFICRETYSACKDTVLADFIDILKEYGMYDKSLHTESHPQKYFYEGNQIAFGGRDNFASHGKRNNLIYFNELLLDENDKAYMQLNGRCKEVFICDYNPIYTEHWVYTKVKIRADVKFFKSTFLTNKFLPEGERQEKLGYEPTHPDDRHLPKKKRRPHPTNIANGTADEYMWSVYGEGNAAAAEGIIFRYVTWIESFPQVGYSQAIDFGFTVDPCVIIKYAEDEKNIWAECLSYHPMETSDDIDEYALATGINRRIPTIADSSDRYVSENKGTVEMVKDLDDKGWNIEKVSKTKSTMYWLTSMKKKKIHIVKNGFYKQVLVEKENYRMKTINGVSINQPIDKHNHFFDSLKYGHISHNQPKRKAFWD